MLQQFQIGGSNFSSSRSPKSAFDWITKGVIPLLSLIALILAQLKDQKQFQVPLLVLLSIFVVAGFGPWLYSRSRKAWDRGRDGSLADDYTERIRSLAAQFGDFIASNRTDTLHAILQNEIFSHDSGAYQKVRLPSRELYEPFWRNLTFRCKRPARSLEDFAANVRELSTLVTSFHNNVVLQLFNYSDNNFRAALGERNRSDLNAFRERYMLFANAYNEFGRASRGKFKTVQLDVYELTHPKPI